MTASRGVAVVTGASGGIGAATARRLAAEGFEVVIGARRQDRLAEVADEIGARALPLDVTDADSVAAFCAAAAGPGPSVLVNNAGGALGLDPFAEADLDGWRWMYEANVLGAVRVTNGLLDALEASGDGHVVLVGSIAGFQPYPGGAGYNAAKFGGQGHDRGPPAWSCSAGRCASPRSTRAWWRPTSHSCASAATPSGRRRCTRASTPLTADDVADCIAFAVTRPSHVNIDQIVLRPRQQASATMLHRNP